MAQKLLEQCEACLTEFGFFKDDNPGHHHFNLDVPTWGVYAATLFYSNDMLHFMSNCDNSHMHDLDSEDGNTEVDYRLVWIENVDQLKFCITNSSMLIKYTSLKLLIGYKFNNFKYS